METNEVTKKTWREEHREEINERSKKYMREHKEERRAYLAEYRKKNKEKNEQWRVNSCIRKILKKYGVPAENGETYIDLDGIRLVFNDVEFVGWYNPNFGMDMES